MHATTWIKLLVVGLLLLNPQPSSAQAPCDAGNQTLATNSWLSTYFSNAVTADRESYLVVEGGPVEWNINGTLSSADRAPLENGTTYQFRSPTGAMLIITRCDSAFNGTPSPTAEAYPEPVTPTSAPTSAPTSTPNPSEAYPAPTPLPTMLPDQTLETLTTHGQAITATASAPVGVAIISMLLLWAGMRLLVWGRRRR